MKAKEKAKELFFKFREITFFIGEANEKTPIECALMCVDEIIQALMRCKNTEKIAFEYWQEVRKEIENL